MQRRMQRKLGIDRLIQRCPTLSDIAREPDVVPVLFRCESEYVVSCRAEVNEGEKCYLE